MTQLRYSPGTELYDPNPIRGRATNIGTVYGHSRSFVPTQPQVLDRPGRWGNYEGQTVDFAPSRARDALIIRQRAYIWRRADYVKPGDTPGNHSWVDDGPIRDMPTTRFNRNIRPAAGSGLHDASDWGQHTNIPSGQKSGNQLKGKAAMKAGRQNRLTVQRYRGQSFSSTTQIVGR